MNLARQKQYFEFYSAFHPKHFAKKKNKLVSPHGTVFANVDISVSRWSRSRQNEEQWFLKSPTQVTYPESGTVPGYRKTNVLFTGFENEIMHRINL